MNHLLVRSRRAAAFVVAICLGAIAFAGCDQKRQEVIASIQELGRALSDRNGERAASLYTQSTFDFYDRMLQGARTAKRDQIAKMPPLERMEILLMRLRVPPSDLKTIDGRGFIKMSVSNGWWQLHQGMDRVAEDLDF